jgi:hypothetical protein
MRWARLPGRREVGREIGDARLEREGRRRLVREHSYASAHGSWNGGGTSSYTRPHSHSSV